jgi:hypothetical protein
MAFDILKNLSGPMTLFLFAVGIMLLYLRFRARRDALTAVQAWGLTYLGLHFFILGLAQLTWYTGSFFVIKDWSVPAGRIGWDLNTISPVFLLAFGLTFPRPIYTQKKLHRLFGIIFATAFLLAIAFVLFKRFAPAYAEVLGNYVHIICWFGAIFFWLPSYEKEPDPRTKTIVALMIWGVMFYPFVSRFSIWMYSGFLDVPGLSVSTLGNGIAIGFIIIVLARLLWPLRKRSGSLTTLETNMVVLTVFAFVLTLLTAIAAMPSANPSLGFMIPLITVFALSVLRPALMCYGLLRYNFFGPEVRADRGMTIVATMCLVLLGALIVGGAAEGIGASPYVVAVVAGVLLLLPAYYASRWAVERMIPPARTGAPLKRSEAREIYFMTLQTAVHRGKISNPDDEVVLANLRKDLAVSIREHGLLLEWLKVQSPVSRRSGKVERAVLVLDDGRLVAHAGPSSEGDADDDLAASMLIAIRGYVRDTGGSAGGELNTFKYGDRTMAVEHIAPLALASLHDSEPSPYTRLALLDELAEIVDSHGKLLRKWDGVVEDVEPIKKELARIVDRYSRDDELV